MRITSQKERTKIDNAYQELIKTIPRNKTHTTIKNKQKLLKEKKKVKEIKEMMLYQKSTNTTSKPYMTLTKGSYQTNVLTRQPTFQININLSRNHPIEFQSLTILAAN